MIIQEGIYDAFAWYDNILKNRTLLAPFAHVKKQFQLHLPLLCGETRRRLAATHRKEGGGKRCVFICFERLGSILMLRSYKERITTLSGYIYVHTHTHTHTHTHIKYHTEHVYVAQRWGEKLRNRVVVRVPLHACISVLAVGGRHINAVKSLLRRKEPSLTRSS